MISKYFRYFDGLSRDGIARLTVTGVLDDTFVVGSGTHGSTIYAMSAQPDGKLVIAGSFAQYNNIQRKNIARLHADGSVDATFDP